VFNNSHIFEKNNETKTINQYLDELHPSLSIAFIENITKKDRQGIIVLDSVVMLNKKFPRKNNTRPTPY